MLEIEPAVAKAASGETVVPAVPVGHEEGACAQVVPAGKICPANAAPGVVPACQTVPEGVPKFGWFKMLKISARNSSFPPSPRKCKGVSFVIEKFTVASPGPRRISRAALPKVPAGCSVKAQGSNHRFGVPNF